MAMSKKAFIAAITTSLILISILAGMQDILTVEETRANFMGPPLPPEVTIFSPIQLGKYNTSDVPFDVKVELFDWTFIDVEQLKWLNYSLDKQEAVPIQTETYTKGPVSPSCLVTGNGTLWSLSEGNHSLRIQGETTFDKKFNASVTFLVETAKPTTNIAPTAKPSKLPTPSPTQSLMELPYAAGNFYPLPNSTNVSLNTTISISFSRRPSICNMSISPNIAIKERVFRAEGIDATFIFYLSEQLQPKTTYTVTATYGQETAPEGSKPTTTRTWHFTTETNSPMQQPTATPSPSPTIPEFPTTIIVSFLIVALIATATLHRAKLSSNQNKKEKH
jgi:hypothetical protein